MAKLKTKIVFDDNDVDKAAGIYTGEDGKRCVEIHEWDMNKLHPWSDKDVERGVKVVVIGKPGTGKSRIIESIMLFKEYICPVIQIFSGTETVNHFYGNRCTDVTIFDKLDMKALEDFIRRQDISRKYLPNPWAIQILDDVTDEPNLMSKPVFNALFKRGRHFVMIHIEAVQYPMDLKPAIRSCVDYLFVLPNSNLSERQKIYENFGAGAIPTFQDFCDIMDSLEEHMALVIDNTIASGKLPDRVFYYVADVSRIPPNWKYGCPESWEFNDERKDPNYQPSLI